MTIMAIVGADFPDDHAATIHVFQGVAAGMKVVYVDQKACKVTYCALRHIGFDVRPLWYVYSCIELQN